MKLASKADLRRAARTPSGAAGLLLLLVGAASAIGGGLTLGVILAGHPAHRAILHTYIVVQFGMALGFGVLGNWLWYRARIATRHPDSRS